MAAGKSADRKSSDRASGASLPDLVDRLKSGDPEERRLAIVEITRLNDGALLAHVAPLAADPDAAVRYYAKKAIASLGAARKGDEAVPPASIVPRESRARVDAILAAVEAGARDQLPEFLARLAVEEDPFVRATLLRAVGRLGDRPEAAFILPFLKDPDARVVANAVEALATLGDPASQVAMLDLLAHPDARVKGNIAKALWHYTRGDEIGASLLLDRLRGMLASDKPWDRESAVHVLGQIGTPEAVVLLAPALSDPEEHIRKMAEALTDLHSAGNSTAPAADAAKGQPAAGPPTTGLPIAGSPTAGPHRPARKPKPAVHVADEWRVLFDTPGTEGVVGRILRAAWDPARTPRENLPVAGLFVAFVLAGLFVFLVGIDVFSLLFAPPVAGPAGAPVAADDRAAEAGRYAAAGEHGRALALLAAKPALSAGERSAFEASARASYQACSRAGDAAGCRDLLATWSATLPDSAEAATAAGDFALAFEGNPEVAAVRYRQALTLEKDRVGALLGLGDAALFAGRPVDALPYYRKALERDAGDARALFSTGNAYAYLGKRVEAVAHFRRAAEADPASALAQFGLGKSLAATDPDGARRALETACALDPTLAAARLELGRLLLAGDPPRALEALKAATELDPAAPDAAREYALALQSLRMWDPAAAAWDRLLALVPDDPAALAERGACLLELDQPARAKASLDRALALDPESGPANYHLARLAATAGDLPAAERGIKRALERNYEPLAARLALVGLYLNNGRHGEALAQADLGLAAYPGDRRLLCCRGAALIGLDKREDAKGVFLGLAAGIAGDDPDLATRIRFYMAQLGAAAPAGTGGTNPR